MHEKRALGANPARGSLVGPGVHLELRAVDGGRARGADALSSSRCLEAACSAASGPCGEHRTVWAYGRRSTAASGAAYHLAVGDHHFFSGARRFAAWRSGTIRVLPARYHIRAPRGGITK